MDLNNSMVDHEWLAGPLVEPAQFPAMVDQLERVVSSTSVSSFQGLGQNARMDSQCLRVTLGMPAPELTAVAMSPVFPVFRSLSRQIVLDLGAGITPFGYLVAAAAGAMGYIGVERFHAPKLCDALRALPVGPEVCPAIVIERDMREVLCAMPDKSVSVLAVGLDNRLFAGCREVLNTVSQLLRERLHVNGVVVSVDSRLDLTGLHVTRRQYELRSLVWDRELPTAPTVCGTIELARRTANG